MRLESAHRRSEGRINVTAFYLQKIALDALLTVASPVARCTRADLGSNEVYSC